MTPLPAGITPKPRKRKRSALPSNEGLRAAKEAVSVLSDQDPGQDDFEHYRLETGRESGDRGAAILLATNVKNALQISIRRWLPVSGALRQELFKGPVAPAGTFAAKIIIGHALGIYGPATRQNLDIIRIAHVVVAAMGVSRAVEHLGVIISRPVLGGLHHQYSRI
jgi:hypothetical protein